MKNSNVKSECKNVDPLERSEESILIDLSREIINFDNYEKFYHQRNFMIRNFKITENFVLDNSSKNKNMKIQNH